MLTTPRPTPFDYGVFGESGGPVYSYRRIYQQPATLTLIKMQQAEPSRPDQEFVVCEWVPEVAEWKTLSFHSTEQEAIAEAQALAGTTEMYVLP